MVFEVIIGGLTYGKLIVSRLVGIPSVPSCHLLHEELNGEAIGPSGELKFPLEDDLTISVTLIPLMKLNGPTLKQQRGSMVNLRLIRGPNSRWLLLKVRNSDFWKARKRKGRSNGYHWGNCPYLC
jgi:hypothetical protein